MIHRFFSFLAKISLFALSALIGAGCYIFVKANEDQQIALTPIDNQSLESLTYRREVAFNAEPILLAKAQSPVDLSGDALGVIYILEKGGDILRVDNASALAVSTRYAALADTATEANIGFTALAFHPEFLAKDRPGFGKFYVAVSEAAGSGHPDFISEFGPQTEHHQDVVYEYTTPFPLAGNFKGAKREIIRFSQPGAQNNLGSLTFDHLGHLYLGVGDGAAGEVNRESPSRNASSLTSAFGKVLRIDPTGNNSTNGSYGIPESNPFKMVSEALPELWAFGLRAPHSLHFDPFLRSLCIGETANNGTEEINVSEFGGEHFGWDLKENSQFFDFVSLSTLQEIVTEPKLSINRYSGIVGRNTGNIVYRGESFPALAGKLIFASHDGQLMACDPREGSSPGAPLRVLDLGSLGEKQFAALRTTPMGELVLLCEDGSIFEMRKNQEIGSGKPRKRPLYCLTNQISVPQS